MAAVFCCALYAASALVLCDPLFVYVLMAGVAGTGLLILADMQEFAEIASPSLMLVVMGLIGIHAERAFADNEGPFSRRRFGLAFFFSGHVLLGGGLILLLAAQVTGWLLRPFFPGWNIQMPAVATEQPLKLLAIVMVIAATYAYLYSDLVVRRIGVYIYAAAFTLLWAELLGLQLLDLQYAPQVIIGALGLTALALNALQPLASRQAQFSRAVIPLGLMLSMLAVVYAVLLHLRATHTAIHEGWPYQVNWGYVLAVALAAICCRIGAYLYRSSDGAVSGAYFFLTGAASLVGAAGLLSMLGITNWASQAPILMLIPLAYLIISRVYSEGVERNSLAAVAQAATVVMVVAVLASATNVTPRVFEPVEGHRVNLLLASFFAEGAIFYALAASIRKHGRYVFFATAMAGAALWQVLSFYQTDSSAYMITFGVLGLILLIASRLAAVGEIDVDLRTPHVAAKSAGCALMSLSFLSSALMVTSKLLTRPQWSNGGLLALMMLLTLVAAVVVGQSAWRRAFIVMTVINGMLAFVLLGVMSHLSGWQKAEVFAVGAGLVMLISGHIGWFREQGSPSDTVSFNLMLGALLAGVPLLIAAVVNRFGADVSLPDEIGLVTISVLMLITGLMLQLRATTLIGGALLALHVALLLAFASWKAQLAIGVYLAIGGGVLFLIGLGLAIYREQLLLLPAKIEQRQGVFRILAWR